MHSVRVVKRKEREAANDLGIADETPTLQRMTAEMVVKSWITATRERRDGEIKDGLVDFKRGLLVSD